MVSHGQTTRGWPMAIHSREISWTLLLVSHGQTTRGWPMAIHSREISWTLLLVSHGQTTRGWPMAIHSREISWTLLLVSHGQTTRGWPMAIRSREISWTLLMVSHGQTTRGWPMAIHSREISWTLLLVSHGQTTMAIHSGEIHSTAVTSCSAVTPSTWTLNFHRERLVPYGRNSIFDPFNAIWDSIEANQGINPLNWFWYSSNPTQLPTLGWPTGNYMEGSLNRDLWCGVLSVDLQQYS